jgi:hypothetical protein
VADIVRAGKIRIGLHLPQFVQDPNSGAIHGHGTGTVIVPLAQALAEHLKVKLELVGNRAPPVLIKCLQDGGCERRSRLNAFPWCAAGWVMKAIKKPSPTGA